MAKIVAKFGGSSVKDAEALTRCLNILKKTPQIKVAVISATYNSTNQLTEITAFLEKKQVEKAQVELELFFDRHLELAKNLNSTETLFLQLENLHSCGKKLLLNYSISEYDEMLSLGEQCSSLLFSDLLKRSLPERDIYLKDAREVVLTDSFIGKANVCKEDVKKAIIKHWPELSAKRALIITQGFIGKDYKGVTRTLGREGSDYSAALFAYGIDADLLQIWTDVEGIASYDPNKVEDAHFYKELSFEQAKLMAKYGAKILFKKTLDPLLEKKIPVWVGSTLAPEALGTRLLPDDGEIQLGMTSDSSFFYFFGDRGIVARSSLESLLGTQGEVTEFGLRFLKNNVFNKELEIKLHRIWCSYVQDDQK